MFTEKSKKINKNNAGVAKKYGAHYFYQDQGGKYVSKKGEMYYYEAGIADKNQPFKVDRGDSLITVRFNEQLGEGFARWKGSSGQEDSVQLADKFYVKIRGYQCGDKSAQLTLNTNLPYVNGCSTRQIFPPERLGDPTLQQLTIPPYTSEQVHHIHPTARVVYVLEGEGYSIVGQKDNSEETKLTKGMLTVLEPMCPHHFRTESKYLTVLPVHIFSSVGGLDNNHPMFNGTKEI